MNKFISKTQKKEFLALIAQVFVKIRALSREPNTKEKCDEILKLSDGFHNIPSLLIKENLEKSRLLMEVSMIEEPYRQAALNIIMAKTYKCKKCGVDFEAHIQTRAENITPASKCLKWVDCVCGEMHCLKSKGPSLKLKPTAPRFKM